MLELHDCPGTEYECILYGFGYPVIEHITGARVDDVLNRRPNGPPLTDFCDISSRDVGFVISQRSGRPKQRVILIESSRGARDMRIGEGNPELIVGPRRHRSRYGNAGVGIEIDEVPFVFRAS